MQTETTATQGRRRSNERNRRMTDYADIVITAPDYVESQTEADEIVYRSATLKEEEQWKPIC